VSRRWRWAEICHPRPRVIFWQTLRRAPGGVPL
jgi:hypothetical protein